jgi:subtilisin family serine protease
MFNLRLSHISILIGVVLSSFLLALPLQVLSQPNRDYIPGRLVVKMAANTQLNEIRMKRGVDPMDQVQDFLAGFGGSRMQAYWTAEKEQQLRRQIQKRKVGFDQDPANELRSVYTLTYQSDVDAEYLASKVRGLPGVAYAEPVYVRQTTLTPNDPQAEAYINYQNFPAAWDITTGSEDVIVAIVDSGVYYKHEDLTAKIWINEDEIPVSVRTLIDANSDGKITPAEIIQYLQDHEGDHNSDGVIDLQDGLHSASNMTTGTDTDNNGGYVDDIYGWDFWDSGNLFIGEPAQSDNDPIGSGSAHGTHVAGTAAAATNNGIGVAGTGYNVRYMAVKVGGIIDDPSTEDDESRSIGFGYEGIEYAALNGADVINNSWGGGNYSGLENDIINMATELGAVVISSAGNSNADGSGYPGAYQNCLSVGSVNTNSGVKSDFSNYGYDVGIMATGNSILSSIFYRNDLGEIVTGYAYYSGTSMSSPVVSGLAGLLKSQHPDWSPLEIIYQIQGTATSVEENNSESYKGKLGSGVINAERALGAAVPGIRLIDFEILNERGQKIFKGESGNLKVHFANLGAADATNLSFNISTLSDNIIVDSSPISVASVASGDTSVVSFDITLQDNFDITSYPAFFLEFSDPNTNYSDSRAFRYEELLYDEVNANGIRMSFGADGTIGFRNPINAEGGIGFIPKIYNGSEYQSLENILFEGGLIIEANKTIANSIRGASNAFLPLDTYKVDSPGMVSDADGRVSMNTSQDSNFNPLTVVDLNTYAFDDDGLRNVLFVEYVLRNTSDNFLLNNTHVGLFHDWDIGNSSNNNVSYSPQDSILYAYEPNSTLPYVAVAHLGNVAGALAIDNAYDGVDDSTRFGLYDGFNETEKKWALRSRTYHTEETTTDISTMVSSGPYNIAPGQSITVGFVYAHGQTLDQLRTQVANARALNLIQVSKAGQLQPVDDPIADKSHLKSNYPNPFNPSTNIQFELSRNSETTLEVYNILGQKVATLVDQELSRGFYSYEFNAAGLSSGVYIAVLKTEEGINTRKINLLK